MSQVLSLFAMIVALALSGTMFFFTPLYGHLLLGKMHLPKGRNRRSDWLAFAVYGITAFFTWRGLAPHPTLYPGSYRSLQICFPLFTVSYWTLMRRICNRLWLVEKSERTFALLFLLPVSQLCLGLMIQSGLMTCSVVLSTFAGPQPDADGEFHWWVVAAPLAGVLLSLTLMSWLPRLLHVARSSEPTDNLGVAPE